MAFADQTVQAEMFKNDKHVLTPVALAFQARSNLYNDYYDPLKMGKYLEII